MQFDVNLQQMVRKNMTRDSTVYIETQVYINWVYIHLFRDEQIHTSLCRLLVSY